MCMHCTAQLANGILRDRSSFIRDSSRDFLNRGFPRDDDDVVVVAGEDREKNLAEAA